MVRGLLTLMLCLAASAGAWAGSSGSPTLAGSGLPSSVDLIRVEILDLRPTQFVVGYRYVENKSDELRKLSKKQLRKYMLEHPIPAIRGYDGELYMIDHHHLARAALDAKIDRAYVQVIHDWSQLHLTRDEFWDRMKDGGFVYLRDDRNRLRSVHSLSDTVSDLSDDPYRALAGEVRDEGGYRKSQVPFTEFTWANYFRATIPRAMIDAHWKKSVALAMDLARSPDAQTLPGYRGKMCSELFR